MKSVAFDQTLDARWLDSFVDADRAAWDSLFNGCVEGFDFFRGCELAPPSGFDLSAVGAFERDRLCGGIPVFKSTVRLDLLFPPALRSIGSWLDNRFPSLTQIKVLAAGSPHADELTLAIDPTFDARQRLEVLDRMLAGLERKAKSEKVSIIGLKNVTDRDRLWSDPVFASRGYARIASLPIAVFDVPASEGDYFANLSPNMRRSLKRKLKKAAGIRVEMRQSVDGVEDQLIALREATRARAGTNYDAFEAVAPGFYRAIMEQLGGRSRLLLYWHGDLLLGFSLVLLEAGRLKEKYSGLRYPEALDYSIFFLNWMTLVRLCIAEGIPRLHAGETTYITKARLGCRLERSWLYFRHPHPVWNRIFGALAPLAALDTSDRDLLRLGEAAPYLEPEGLTGSHTRPPVISVAKASPTRAEPSCRRDPAAVA